MASAEAEQLYGLPPDEFTAARDELARAHRRDGRREEAAEVAALRKPVLAAWVVNRLARDERKEMQRLVDAAAAIRSGKGADREFREALDRLTAAGRELLVSEGRSADATLQQVASTLRAGAASHPDLLLTGTLTQPIEASGFGAMAGAAPAPSTRRPARAKAEPHVDRKAVERARRAVTEARDDARRLEREASAAEREARRARQAAETARERVNDAESKLAEARGR